MASNAVVGTMEGEDEHARAAHPLPGGQKQRGKQTRSITTRLALISAARELFGEVGYHATGTNDVVARAAVARGALYHHFASKEELFETVYRQVARELSSTAMEATRDLSGKTWTRIISSIRIYLATVAARRDIQRILLIDGPAVIGWQRWRELQVEFRLVEWEEALRMLHEQGVIVNYPREPLAHLLVALLDDAALSVAHAADTEEALERMTGALEILMGGLRKDRI